MLEKEIENSCPSQVKKFYKEEIKFAKDKMAQIDVFNASDNEYNIIEEKKERKIQNLEKIKGVKVRQSMRIPWMTNYSNIGADRQVSNILALEKALS